MDDNIDDVNEVSFLTGNSHEKHMNLLVIRLKKTYLFHWSIDTCMAIVSLLKLFVFETYLMESNLLDSFAIRAFVIIIYIRFVNFDWNVCWCCET